MLFIRNMRNVRKLWVTQVACTSIELSEGTHCHFPSGKVFSCRLIRILYIGRQFLQLRKGDGKKLFQYHVGAASSCSNIRSVFICLPRPILQWDMEFAIERINSTNIPEANVSITNDSSSNRRRDMGLVFANVHVVEDTTYLMQEWTGSGTWGNLRSTSYWDRSKTWTYTSSFLLRRFGRQISKYILICGFQKKIFLKIGKLLCNIREILHSLLNLSEIYDITGLLRYPW